MGVIHVVLGMSLRFYRLLVLERLSFFGAVPPMDCFLRFCLRTQCFEWNR